MIIQITKGDIKASIRDWENSLNKLLGPLLSGTT